MARSASEQALVDYILNSIRTRSTNELLDYHSKMDVTLKEMMNNGLSASQINGLPVDFIRLFIEDGNISLEDLEDAGVDDQVIQGVNPNYTSTILEPEPIFEPINETFTPIMDPSQNNGFSEIQSKESILEDVRNNKALIANVQEALNRRVIDSNDLANLGFSYEFIDRLQQYVPQPAIFPEFKDLPPLREDSSDIYFLGMPKSGKSTMLAALFSYCNEIGVMGNIVDNQFGNKYRNQLVLTGEVNDVGAYNRANVDNSYRAGIEAEFGVKIFKNLLKKFCFPTPTISFAFLLNTDLVPTKNFPFSGLMPAKIAGAPSHFVVTFTLDCE